MDLDALVPTMNATIEAATAAGDRPIDLLLTMCVQNSTETKTARKHLAPFAAPTQIGGEKKRGRINVMSATVPHSVWYRKQYGYLPVDGSGSNRKVSSRAYARVRHELLSRNAQP